MKYTTTYLRAESYEAFMSECITAGLTVNGEIITSSHNHSMVMIGDLYKETGETTIDDTGELVPVKAKVPGYHVNLRYKKPVGLEHLVVEPENILVQWAE